jgi:chaperonin GroEL (HSP60 family)
LTQRDRLISAATTSLSSKVVSQDSSVLAPIAVDAVLAITDPEATNVDLRNIKIVKALGGAIEDSELVHGLVFNKRASHVGESVGVAVFAREVDACGVFPQLVPPRASPTLRSA